MDKYAPRRTLVKEYSAETSNIYTVHFFVQVLRVFRQNTRKTKRIPCYSTRAIIWTICRDNETSTHRNSRNFSPKPRSKHCDSRGSIRPGKSFSRTDLRRNQFQDILYCSGLEPAERTRLSNTIKILKGDLNLDFMNAPLEGDSTS